MSRQQIAIGLIWNSVGQLAIGRRAEGTVLAGYDELPGGKCQEGESPEEAVIRECLEETGQAVRVMSLRLTTLHDYAHGQLELHFYDCQVTDKLAPLQTPFRWWSVAEVLAGHFPPANKDLLNSLRTTPHPIV